MYMRINLHHPVAALAAKQHGNITRKQLLSVGVGPGAIAHWIKAGHLFAVHRGVYAVGRPPKTPLEKAAAAVLACGEDGAALSHASAMANWGFWKRWDIPFEISVTRDRRPPGITVHHPRTLHRRDIRTQHAIRTTSPARTLLDIAARLTDKQLTRAVNNALHSHYLTESQLADLVARHPSPRLNRFVDTSKGLTRSDLEDDFLAFCERYDLPRPKMNVLVNGYLVDAYFPQQRLIVEIDSHEFHSTRIDFETDRNRDADQLSDGIPTVRVTHARMKRRPNAEAARLETILANRA